MAAPPPLGGRAVTDPELPVAVRLGMAAIDRSADGGVDNVKGHRGRRRPVHRLVGRELKRI